MLTAIAGRPPGGDVVESILARSNGNAFFAEELLAAGGGGAELPATLREVLLARIATLSKAAQGFVRAASASDTRITPGIMATVLEAPLERVMSALREALAAHVLVRVNDHDDGQYAFRHALVQEAVLGELLAGERRRLHERFANALEGMPEVGDASLAAELAHHRQAADDLPRAFDAWMSAGTAAERIFALSQALTYFERAIALWDQVPDADTRAPIDRVDLLSRAAVLAEGTDPRRSVHHIQTALGFLDARRDPVRAGLLHERLGQYGQYVVDAATNRAAYEEAARLVPEDPPNAARAWVLSGLSRYFATNVSDPERAIELAERALVVAKAARAREVEPRALLPLGTALVRRGDVEAGLASLREAATVASELRDIHQLANSLSWLASGLYEAGRYLEAVTAGEEAIAFAERHGLGERWATTSLFWLDESLVALGRWNEAENALGRAEDYVLHGASQLVLETKRLRLETLRGQLQAATARASRLPQLAAGFDFELTAAVLAEFALATRDPLAARGVIASAIGAVDLHPDTRVRRVGRYVALGIRAEAELVTGAGPITFEDAARSRSIAEALLARMQALERDTAANRPYYAPSAPAHERTIGAVPKVASSIPPSRSTSQRW